MDHLSHTKPLVCFPCPLVALQHCFWAATACTGPVWGQLHRAPTGTRGSPYPARGPSGGSGSSRPGAAAAPAFQLSNVGPFVLDDINAIRHPSQTL